MKHPTKPKPAKLPQPKLCKRKKQQKNYNENIKKNKKSRTSHKFEVSKTKQIQLKESRIDDYSYVMNNKTQNPLIM